MTVDFFMPSKTERVDLNEMISSGIDFSLRSTETTLCAGDCAAAAVQT